jgi:uncharacterized protein
VLIPAAYVRQEFPMSDTANKPKSSASPERSAGRNKLIVGLIAAAILGTAATSLYTNLNGTDLSRQLQQKSPQAQGRLERLEISSGGKAHVFQVETMRNDADRAKGLMFRQFMAEDRGMLFDFEREQPVSMWMRNTYIPLDMLFIKADGRIHRIHERAQPLDETSISSGENVRYVLELNGGIAGKLGLKAGDMVKLPTAAR